MDIDRPDLQKKSQRKRRALMIAGVALTLAVIVYVVTLGTPNPRIKRAEIWLGTVEQSDMLRDVRGIGRLVPEQQRWVTARISGRVEERMVQSGAAVHPETVILRLSNASLEQQYENAKLELQAAEAELSSTHVRLQGEMLAMRSQLTQLREQSEMATLDAQINEQLFADGLVSELNLKRSKLSAHHLVSRLQLETERLAFQEQAIAPQLAGQQTLVDRARARLQLLEEQVDALYVRAGSGGVVQRLTIEAGMTITEGQELALVADPSKLKAVIEIQESQAREIRVGQPAVVDTRSSGMANAIVSRIDPNVERGVVRVDVVFPDGLPEGTRAEQSVQGTIELQRLPNVVHIDRPTTAREDTRGHLYVLNASGSRADRVPVVFGRASVSRIEVLSGLNPGDQVILSDVTRWENTSQLEIR